MKIRSITIGQNIPILYEHENTEKFLEDKLDLFSLFNRDLTNSFIDQGIGIESKRICSQPLISYADELVFRKNVKETFLMIENELEVLQNLLKIYGFDYYSCSTMHPQELEHFDLFDKLLLNDFDILLKKYANFFTSIPAISDCGISFLALKVCAKLIKKLSAPDPFNNLKFCVSYNVPSNTPFFPAAYHSGKKKPQFSLALEMADEVVKIIDSSKSLMAVKSSLRNKFEEIYNSIIYTCEKIAKKYDLEFKGVDFSPAPYPRKERSIGEAIEKMGVDYFGSYGSLLGVSIITDAIPKKEKIIGFSGFMQPILEDKILAERLKEKRYDIDTLLLYSTVCGTGLDCVPLPGDVTEEELFNILLDVAVISLTHKKPLTARLMPMPHKSAGDEVNFEFEYFAPSKVIEIKRINKSANNRLFHRSDKFYNIL
ncbi:MAG: DUF711 family protein [Candidatus Lokiarchaeota archaeon]|nr:DUF711 family protein [Candidatus Lokiarchaeota archaeon]MBD3337635.1 DUF711 family protein [Candidatus Lokiarchaeota archaeon]